jgi:hypothetical protein
MTTHTNTQQNEKSKAWIGGIILILVGSLALAMNFVPLSAYLLLMAPGMVFLAWGLLARKTALLVPGGVLSGLAAGIYLIEGPLAKLGEPANGGVFMLAFGAGFLLVSLLSLYTEGGRLAWWPLIPGGIMATFGGLLLAGENGLKALQFFGQGWPVVMIAIGLYLILRRRDMTQK